MQLEYWNHKGPFIISTGGGLVEYGVRHDIFDELKGAGQGFLVVVVVVVFVFICLFVLFLFFVFVFVFVCLFVCLFVCFCSFIFKSSFSVPNHVFSQWFGVIFDENGRWKCDLMPTKYKNFLGNLGRCPITTPARGPAPWTPKTPHLQNVLPTIQNGKTRPCNMSPVYMYSRASRDKWGRF